MRFDNTLKAASTAECVYPKRSRCVAIGPSEYMGGKVAYFVKNRVTGKFHRMGRREALLLQLMDGSKSCMEIREAYEQLSDVRLSPNSLQRFIEQMRTRGLLETGLPDQTTRPPIVYRQGFLACKLLVFNPDRLMLALQPYCGWLFHPAFAIACLAISVLTEIWVFRHFPAIWSSLSRSTGHTGVSVVSGISVFLIVASVHEFAHGLACKRYGGEVPEIGLLFRYLTLYPYTKVDDIVLFHNRSQRVWVLAAGTATSLLFLPVFAVAWFLTHPGGVAHMVCAYMLVWFNLGVLLNFVPFIQLDGYFVLAHLVHAPDLLPDSYKYLKECVLDIFGYRAATSSYPRSVQVLFIVYSSLSLTVTATVMSVLGRYEYLWLYQRIGGAAVIVVLAILLVATHRYWSGWYKRSRSSGSPTTEAAEPGAFPFPRSESGGQQD